MQSTIINNLQGASLARQLAQLLYQAPKQSIVITPEPTTATTLAKEVQFFNESINCHHFPDWQTLAYDILSPHQSVISERIACLAKLIKQETSVFFISIKTIMSLVCPPEFIGSYHLVYKTGDTINQDNFRAQCTKAGYITVPKVMEPGECAFRGSVIDIFPTGIKHPLRLDLFDDEIDSIKTFDVESQRSLENIGEINLLPAHEFATDEHAISQFRRNWREQFSGKASICPIYNDVSEGIIPSGIEYYLPLFFEKAASIFDYLADDCQLYLINEVHDSASQYLNDVKLRYEQRSSDITRPILAVDKLFLSVEHLFSNINKFNHFELKAEKATKYNAALTPLPPLTIDRKQPEPLALFQAFIKDHAQKQILVVAESAGRKEVLLETFKQAQINPTLIDNWQQFVEQKPSLALLQGPLETGCAYTDEPYIIVTEVQFFGDKIIRQKRQKSFDPDVIIRSLTEL